MNNSKRWVSWTLLGLAGGGAVAAALLNGLEQNNYLFSLGCGLLGALAGQIIRTLYWAMPSRREERQRRLKEQEISLGDERKIMLSQLSGYRMNQIMFFVNFLLCLFFGLLKAPLYVTATMAFVLVFQYLCGVILFHRYSKTM